MSGVFEVAEEECYGRRGCMAITRDGEVLTQSCVGRLDENESNAC